MAPRVALAVVLLAGCGGGTSSTPAPKVVPDPAATPTPAPAPAPPPAGPVARQLAAETVVKTAWQASLTIPASWFVTETPTVVRVQAPEKDVRRVTVVKAADRDAAVAAAWKLISPGFALAVAQAVDLPGRDGWDTMGQIAYVTKTEDSRAVIALARRKGDTWHVTTIDGKVAGLGRRGAQLNAIVIDMKVPGLEEESFAGKTPNLDADHLKRFDAFVADARQLARVPGVAIAIVHGGKTLVERGYGVRSVKTKAPVGPSTLFMIGSTTKSLTTLMLARLVDQQKFDWTTPVVQLLPAFKLADPGVTGKVTVQHTVCACTGMPRQDLEFLFEYDGWDPERRLASMAAMKPTTGFGETFQYSNLMVATGGWIGAHVFAPAKQLGPAYDEAMQSLVFGPLGMKSTTFDARRATRGDHARSHGHGFSLDYQETPVDYERAVLAVRPAGAAWSNVRDMSRFMLLELARGKTPDGKQLVTEANLLKRREPQVKLDADNAYGLGLFLTSDHGAKLVHHGGNMLGYTADLFMLPDHDLGVVVLTNAGGANAFRSAVRRAFLEIVFNSKPEARENLTTSLDRTKKTIDDEIKLIKPADDAWITPLLGSYNNPELGKLELRKQGAVILLDAGEWTTEVAKKVDLDGVVKVTTTLPPYAGFELVPKTAGGKTTLALDAGQHVYTFTRKSP